MIHYALAIVGSGSGNTLDAGRTCRAEELENVDLYEEYFRLTGGGPSSPRPDRKAPPTGW